MFDRVFSQSSARVVAIARLALAAVFLVATVSDPRLAPTGDVIVLTAYLGFAALVLLLIWRDWWTDARIAVATHVIDILFFMIVVLWPEGYARPYFLFFVFLLLSAAIRWGWRATAFTAAVAILLYLAAGLFVARPAGTGFELQRFIIRSGYLVVLSFILIWFGLRRRFSTGVVVGDGPIVTDNRPRIEYFNFYPIDPMGYDEIAKHREPIDPYLTRPLVDMSGLRTAEKVVNAIWREHEAAAADRPDEARLFVETALKDDPDNAYLRYLRATHGKPDDSSTRVSASGGSRDRR